MAIHYKFNYYNENKFENIFINVTVKCNKLIIIFKTVHLCTVNIYVKK